MVKYTTEKDVFRDIPLRYLGYSNEVGEAFRSLISVRLVYLSYLIASVYVFSHAISRGFKAYKQDRQERNKDLEFCGLDDSTTVAKLKRKTFFPAVVATDTLIWQGLASVVVPGLVVNRTCALSRVILSSVFKTKQLSGPVQRYTVTAIGLCSIPFIIKPIDRSVDKFMDHFIRPFCFMNATKQLAN